uniref:Spermatogenesis associated 33 n=1 Tax=Myotis myotis TaxID=51298 RepID=A0A7J7R4Z4_MYOMY|nr:spermatogenesis associated 33 [Myotis myotis]
MHCPRVSQSRPINCPYIPGEEQMGCTHSGPKPKQRSVDSLSSKSAEGRFRKEGAATQQVPARGVKEKRGAKATSGRSKVVIPQIVITSASDETLTCSIGSQEQRTIHEEMEWGPYARHRNPSTIDAYALQTKE